MTIPEAADYFKTTERTVSDWRKKGAPVDNVAALTTWLESNLRHTTLDTQAVIDRRRKIENAGRAFLRGYTELCESLPFPRCSDWEVVIVASLHQIDHEMENLALTFVPEAANKPKDKEIFERIQAEPWPLTGSAENLELEPPKNRKEKKA
jgi:hypothetical protein